jgi:glycosyltransferase involved in cell wall biosynthesis
MSKQIKVLVIPSDRSGVSKFRSIDPHLFLQSEYPVDFHVDINYEPPMDDMNFWKDYEIVAFHRSIGHNFEKAKNLILTLNKMGIITVCDIDDYWMPTKDHPIYEVIKIHKINEKIIENLKAASYVTTTTRIYADLIRKYNKNVFVFPNAINPKETQFNEPTLESDRVRVGWLGGSSHMADLNLLDKSFSSLKKYSDKLQFVLCGFDTRGSVTEINAETKEQKTRNIKPEETVWARYEEIFTQKYSIISEDYKKYLLKFVQEPYDNEKNEAYVRAWTKPVTSYAKNYAKFDISLAPIKNHIFNEMKSQLKVIESGFYKKAIIASNFGPYSIDLKHALDRGTFVKGGNALLVDPDRNGVDWAKYIEKLMKNPNLVKDLGENLYETVKDTYSLITVTKNRAEFYKSLIK